MVHALERILKTQSRAWGAAFVLATVFLALYYKLSWSAAFPTTGEALRSIGGTIATVAGGLAGFLLAAIALIFALPDRPILADMRASGHFMDLCAWMLDAVFTALLVTVLALLMAILLDGAALLPFVLAVALVTVYFLLQALLRLAITIANVAWLQ